MFISVTDYLDDVAKRLPEKTIFQDNKLAYSASEAQRMAKAIGCAVACKAGAKKPVAIYMKKSAAVPVAFLGTAYADCYYTPIDVQMPLDRVQLILDCLDPQVVIYDKSAKGKIEELGLMDKAILFEDAIETEIDETKLEEIHRQTRQTDLLYVFFTSGSTGVPKGVTISHLALIDCLEWVCKTYNMDENTIMCNQAPLYFDLSIPDVYSPIFCGGTTHFPPKSYFTFPAKIMQYMDENKVNFINWAPSALCNVVNTNAFDVCVPKDIKTVLFIGEVMPTKYLNVWRQYYPETLFVNAYGPTEATYNCMYYNVDREFSEEEMLPLGKACENCQIILLNDEDKEPAPGELGEICVVGQCLSNGYYNNPEKTADAFVQNPLNTKWIERMYRTGDLAFIDEHGDMVFAGRKDFQIKRLGYRIELGEIENSIMAIDGINNVCCLFDSDTSDIIAVYEGTMTPEEILGTISDKIPNYMLPNRFEKIDAMPYNLNDKIDRTQLKAKYITKK